jgi:carbamoyl-phosphate synthase large subunit
MIDCRLELACSGLLGSVKNNYARETSKTAKGGNILVTSASSKISLINSIKKAITKIGGNILLYSADSAPEVISKYFTDKYWNMPALTKISVNEIISYCRQEKIGFIIPTRDGELAFFASAKEELEKEHISVMVPDLDTVNKCLDKILFYNICRNIGLPAIKTSETISAIEAYKYVVKERYGSGSRSIGIDLTKEDAASHALTLQIPVFQPFIKGREYSVDTYMDKNGIIKGVISRERIKVINGEAKITQEIKYQQLEDIAIKVVKEFNIYGHSVTQIIIDDNNAPHIVECNTRFGGASALSIACGLDTFYWFILEEMGEDITKYPFIKTKESLKLIRYETDLII